jgi:hypothetical protein
MSMKIIRWAMVDQGVLLLLELLPTTQLRASPVFDLPTLPSFDALGHYPILQFGAVLIAFVMTVAGLLGWRKGEKIAKAEQAAAPVAELHFDGPIKGIFDALSDIKGRQLLARLEFKDDVALLLSSSRNSIIDRVAALDADMRDCVSGAFRDSNNAMENRTRDVLNSINSLHERVDEIIRNQVIIIERAKKTGRG